MSIYFEVRSSTRPDGDGEQLESSRYSSMEDAEAAARHESAMGFFSSVWQCSIGHFGLLEQYCCEYAAAEVAA